MASRSVVAVVVVVIALVSGCAGTVAGRPLADPKYTPPKPKPTTASELLGKARTLDPCALVGAETLDAFGTAAEAPPESFDYCTFNVQPAGGGAAVVRAGELGTVQSVAELSDAKDVSEPGARLRVFRRTEPDSCVDTVLFTDLVTLRVSADTFDTPDAPVTGLCTLTGGASREIVRRLQSDTPLEHATYPARSIGALDACAALDAATVGAVLGVSSAPTPTPAGHQCRWGAPTVPSLSVRYARGAPSSGTGIIQETIAGRATALTSASIDSRSLCLAEVASGVPSELAQVVVRLPPGEVEQACVDARTIAAKAWVALPG